MTIDIAIVGVGKIARDQHLPVIAANPAFRLVGAVRRAGELEGVPTFRSIADLVAAVPNVAAVTICSPPEGRHVAVREALDHGLHVMLEKPPGATVREVAGLPALAAARGVALFATYHSRCAPAIAPCAAWLAGRTITGVRVRWLEDVRHWHPGQAWIWEPGGLGVFDPGINALSALTAILPHPIFVTHAELSFPANRATPIAAMMDMTDVAGTPIRVDLDWRETGEQVWEIAVDTDAGAVLLTRGGASLDLAGARSDDDDQHAEYVGLYRRFAYLVAERGVDFDLAPIELIADAFMLGRRLEVEPFDD